MLNNEASDDVLSEALSFGTAFNPVLLEKVNPTNHLDECELPAETIAPEHAFDVVSLQLEKRGVTSHPEKLSWKQGTLFLREMVWKESIVAKLDEVHRNDLADQIRGCHTEKSARQCRGCKSTSIFFNRCDVKWCPVCAPRLSRERKKEVEWWTDEIQQPKHVVLTARNSDVLTKGTVQRFKKAFSKLRRTKFASNWLGGFYSLEVTNEGRGWHLHLHALVNARYIDASGLSKEWAKAIGQDFAIVKVKDVRDRDYLAEVTKYTVKGNDLAGWKPEDVVTFIEAFEGLRTFGVFGQLYAKRTEWKAFLDEVREGRTKCQCGCKLWRILTEQEFEWEQATTSKKEEPRPPPLRVNDVGQLTLQTILRTQYP